MKKFRSLKSLAKYLSKNPVDNFIYLGFWFTLDYYDLEGKLKTYGNKASKLTIEVTTENRYKSTKDMKCELVEMLYNSNINYID